MTTVATRAKGRRLLRISVISCMALSVGRCKCSGDQAVSDLTACSHIKNAEKSLQTFLQNHPVGGARDPQSQVGVLGQMISELNAAQSSGPSSGISFRLAATLADASQMQQDISAGRPVTSAALISDFDNLDSLCGEAGSSDITVPR